MKTHTKLHTTAATALLVLALNAGCASTQSGKATPYPLDTCIVSDNELGSMGDPISFVHAGQEYKICCKPCIKKFKADPEKYAAKLQGSDTLKTEAAN